MLVILNYVHIYSHSLGPGTPSTHALSLVMAGARWGRPFQLEQKGDCAFKKQSRQCMLVLFLGAPSAPSSDDAPRQLLSAADPQQHRWDTLNNNGKAIIVFMML